MNTHLSNLEFVRRKCHANIKHGYSTRIFGRSLTYFVWSSMKQRCLNPKNKSYSRYGGKGITVSKSWLDFRNFFSDMGEKPNGLTLDRIDSKKGYSKENCKWSNRFEQAKNRCSVRWIEHKGKKMTARDWAKELGMNEGTLYSRIERGVKLPELLSKDKLCRTSKKI